MADELKAALLGSVILEEQKKLTPEQKEKIAKAQKPVTEFCKMMIDKYGHEAFRKMYVHDAETWERAFEMMRNSLKESQG